MPTKSDPNRPPVAWQMLTTYEQDRARARMDAHGLCAADGVDDERWMPEVPERPTASFGALLAVEARSACRGCPVSGDCLNWAVSTGQDYGVWAGLAQHEIRALLHVTNRDHPAVTAA